MSNAFRFTTPLMMLAQVILILASTAAVHAAEPPATTPREQGSLSESATSAGPAVDTSAMPSSKPATSAASDAPAPSTSRQAAAGGPQAATRPNADRLNLDTTVVTGNRELPKVLYIVPWKKSDLGDLPAQPFNTLLDEALTPVDRDVFRREVTYYGAVSNGGDGAANAPAPQAERSEK